MKQKAVEYSITAKKQDFEIVKILDSADVVNFARKFYHDDLVIYESAFIIMINNAGDTIGYAKISQGGLCGTIVDIRIIAKYAIECLATGVVLVHNHPSGRTTPSRDDENMTKSLKNALQLFQIRLVDSIILTEDSYHSFADNGNL